MGYSKVCDGADWFEPGIQEIIEQELREPARFHRKQWEFAVLFRALQGHRMLDAGTTGLSMGGGKERLLYSLSGHVKELVVTDLYDPRTTWDCARTEDPGEYIKSDPPFQIDASRLTVLNADMRDLPFRDRSFDFCYSTCAVEHIGEMDDFRRHFREVHRVLKDGGVYAFTTEFNYGPETIADPENYVFAWEYLSDLLHSSPFLTEENFNARIARHSVNNPRPSNEERLSESPLRQNTPHVQLLRGRHAFTASLFVLWKGHKSAASSPPGVQGLAESNAFLKEGIRQYEDSLNAAWVSINPFSSLPRGVSPFLADHAAFFSGNHREPKGDTIFHTDYFWWGRGKRTFRVFLGILGPHASVEIRVHAYKTLSSREVLCITSRQFSGPGKCEISMAVETDTEYCYAVLGKWTTEPAELTTIRVESGPQQSDVRLLRAEYSRQFHHDRLKGAEWIQG